MGFGSLLMAGRRAGVATLLKEEIVSIHCVAHRLTLAVAQVTQCLTSTNEKH